MTSHKPSQVGCRFETTVQRDSPPNEGTLRLLFDNHPIPMWKVDPETLNDAADDIIGITCYPMDITDHRSQDRAGQGAEETPPENDEGAQ